MRVLSLSHPLPHPLIDNHTIINAPNIADYQAIVIDARATVELLQRAVRGEGALRTHADVPVVNGSDLDGAAALAELLQRRRDEFAAALDRGAVVAIYLAPTARIGGVVGLHGLDAYFYLPAPVGMAWDAQTIRGSEGQAVAVVDHEHPFVRVFDTYSRDVLYRAAVNERAPGFAAGARIFLRSVGGASVGVDVSVLNGRVVMLPAAAHPDAEWLADLEPGALVQAMADALGTQADEAPGWAARMAVPGLDAQEQAVRAARLEVERAQDALAQAERLAAALARVRDVLWAGGDVHLQAAAFACAEAIGFRALEEDGRAVLRDGDTEVQFVVAASEEAVGMAPHYRLQQRLDAAIEARGVAARGLLLVNGQRTTHPESRSREIVDALRVAAEARGYALLTASSLYRAAVFALEGASEEALAAVRARLTSGSGIVSLDDLVGAN